jgi:hypothetical protein
MAYPDIVALLVAYLDPLLTGPVLARIPDPRPDVFTQVRRVGGNQVRPVRDQPRVDVFSHALTDPAAWALADLTRRSVHALAKTGTLGPVVYRVEETLGPRMIDDPLTGRPRYWATYSILVRADDAVA